MPVPAELVELSGAVVSPSDVPAKHADEAWEFVWNYLRMHGVDGQDRMLVTPPSDGVVLDMSHCYRAVKAPEIPKRIREALKAIGNGVRGGLQRFAQTQPEEMGYLRRDFDRAYSRQFESASLQLVKA